MLRTYTGSCHCGAVRIEADLDISAGTEKCNCTICVKMRLWCVAIRPEAFKLVSGEEALTDYRGRNAVAHHYFCSRCGVRPFERIDAPNMTNETYYNINVACLDDVDIDALIAAPVTCRDGLNDNWGATPDEVRHL
ncbi:GFA family protein [Ensifer adhaerens]|uniref:GFA family protein n=1 Tax=Ensifer adhaerens TaxID=106592 RepID=UPI000CF02F58|nr:GFA family protein [Ensifer adhaerens]